MRTPTTNKKSKRFLDTSVLRPLLTGPSGYREYLTRCLGGARLYISPYVLKEFKIGYIRHLIDFYFLLADETVPTYADAEKLWSEEFQTRRLKALFGLTGQLGRVEGLNPSRRRDKAAYLHRLSDYIIRIWLKVKHRFINNGQNGTRCTLTTVQPVWTTADPAAGFQSFIRQCDEATKHRQGCALFNFVTHTWRQEIDKYIDAGKGSRAEKAIIAIAEVLANITTGGEHVCKCLSCGRVGDAIICLEADRDIPIEHTDHSYDTLCPIVNQPHQKRLSPKAYHKEQKVDRST